MSYTEILEKLAEKHKLTKEEVATLPTVDEMVKAWKSAGDEVAEPWRFANARTVSFFQANRVAEAEAEHKKAEGFFQEIARHGKAVMALKAGDGQKALKDEDQKALKEEGFKIFEEMQDVVIKSRLGVPTRNTKYDRVIAKLPHNRVEPLPPR